MIKAILHNTNLSCTDWQVPTTIQESSKDIKIRFLRGFFDGDGTSSKSCRFFSINKKGLTQISNLLDDIEINHYFEKPFLKKGRKPLYSIRIPSKDKENFLSILKPISKLPGMRG